MALSKHSTWQLQCRRNRMLGTIHYEQRTTVEEKHQPSGSSMLMMLKTGKPLSTCKFGCKFGKHIRHQCTPQYCHKARRSHRNSILTCTWPKLAVAMLPTMIAKSLLPIVLASTPTAKLGWQIMHMSKEVRLGSQIGGLLLHSLKPPAGQCHAVMCGTRSKLMLVYPSQLRFVALVALDVDPAINLPSMNSATL